MEKENVPNHIAIIMDGNRRWAKQRMLPVKMGHKEGANTIEKIVRYANKRGIKHVTAYAFSTENWKRSEEEVSALMSILKQYLDDFSKKADTENFRIRVLGDISVLRKDLKDSIYDAMERTKNNTGVSFNIALNYGGRDEIVKATTAIAKKVKNGEMSLEEIDEDVLSKHMYTYDIPDPDLLIRTSGELRLSGFLICQMAYTEFLFVDKYWPDFNEKDLDEAIEVYKKRNRKFGAN